MSGTHQRYSIIRWWQVYGTGSSLGSGRFVFGLILVVEFTRTRSASACLSKVVEETAVAFARPDADQFDQAALVSLDKRHR